MVLMLTAMRQHAQSWFIKILLGIIVITFVISFGVGTFSNPKEVLVKVGNEEILVSTYLKQYEREYDALRQRFPENADALAKQINLRKQVYERTINRHLMRMAAAERGMRILDQEVSDSIQAQPVFQINNRFDTITYQDILRQNGLTAESYEADLRQDLLLQKYQRDLVNGLIVGQQEVEQRFRLENEKVEVAYVYVDPKAFKLNETPSAERVKAFYEKNPELFTQRQQFKIDYFILALEHLEGSVSVRERAINRYYERHLQTEFTTPRKVRASHILKRVKSDHPPQEQEAIKKSLEGVLAQARDGGDFGQLAKEHSEDPSKESGGDLGFFSVEDMVREVADAAFALKPGEISGIVRSPFGFHIIKVTAEEPEARKSLEEVRAEIEENLRNQRTERKLELESERLAAKMESDGIAAVAASLQRPVENSGWVDGLSPLANLGQPVALYNQIIRSKGGNFGVWKRNPVQGHVFYKIVERKESTVRPLEKVIDQVTAALKTEMEAELAVENAKKQGAELKSAAQMETAAKKLGLAIKQASFTSTDSSIEGVDEHKEFQRKAFQLTPGGEPGVAIGNNKAYWLHAVKRVLPGEEEARNLKQQLQQKIQGEWEQVLVAKELTRLKGIQKIEIITVGYVEN